MVKLAQRELKAPGAAINLPSKAGDFMDKLMLVKIILIIANAVWDLINKLLRICDKK
jgi:hypothetical protein